MTLKIDAIKCNDECRVSDAQAIRMKLFSILLFQLTDSSLLYIDIIIKHNEETISNINSDNFPFLCVYIEILYDYM